MDSIKTKVDWRKVLRAKTSDTPSYVNSFNGFMCVGPAVRQDVSDVNEKLAGERQSAFMRPMS